MVGVRSLLRGRSSPRLRRSTRPLIGLRLSGIVSLYTSVVSISKVFKESKCSYVIMSSRRFFTSSSHPFCLWAYPWWKSFQNTIPHVRYGSLRRWRQSYQRKTSGWDGRSAKWAYRLRRRSLASRPSDCGRKPKYGYQSKA